MAKKQQGSDVDFLGINDLSSIVRGINNEGGDNEKKQAKPQKEDGKEKSAKRESKDGLWDSFIENVQYYKDNTKKGQAIWIDDDIKDSLEMMKGGPLKCSVKTLANAMLRAFIEQNKENCKKYIGASKKGLL